VLPGKMGSCRARRNGGNLKLKMLSGRFWQLDYNRTAKRQVSLMPKNPG